MKETHTLAKRILGRGSSTTNLGVYAILVFLVMLFSLVTDGFFSFTNIMNIIRQIAIVGVAAFGEAFVLLDRKSVV